MTATQPRPATEAAVPTSTATTSCHTDDYLHRPGMLHRERATSGCGITRQLRRAPRDYESAVRDRRHFFIREGASFLFNGTRQRLNGLPRALCIRCGRVACVEGLVLCGDYLENGIEVSPVLSAFFSAVIRTAVARAYTVAHGGIRMTRSLSRWLPRFALFVVFATALEFALGQSTSDRWPGLAPSQLQTVYVLDRSGIETTGKLLGLSPDSLVLLVADAERRFDRADVARIEKRDSLKNGTLIGAVVGVAMGLLAAGLSDCPGAHPGGACPGVPSGHGGRLRACTQGSARESMPSFVGARRSMPRRHGRQALNARPRHGGRRPSGGRFLEALDLSGLQCVSELIW